MAKKKRRRAAPVSPVTKLPASGVMVADAPHPYRESYAGRKWWFLGIKVDQEREQLPCHSHVCGGINWQQGTQRQVDSDGWIGLDDHRRRVVASLYSWQQIQRAVSEVKHFIVRWRRHEYQTARGSREGWATDIISLENRHKVRIDPKEESKGGSYRYFPEKSDVALASYLILIPRTYVKTKEFRPTVKGLPSMLDLDPSLINERLESVQTEQVWEDEPWEH